LFEPLSLILNLALFYAHQKTDSGQFEEEEEEEEGTDWPRAVLCFRLFSSRALSKTFQINLHLELSQMFVRL
jgi:hypothetical protein